MGKRLFLLAGLGLALFGLSACNASKSVALVLGTVTGDTAYPNGLTVGPGATLVVDEAGSTGAITLNVTGNFICAGTIDMRDRPMTITVNVWGDVIVSCTIIFPPDGTPPNTKIFKVVSAGAYSQLPGFKVVNGTYTPPDGTPPT